MKPFRELRTAKSDTDEKVRKAQKLAPIKKSGKERHQMLGELDYQEDIMDYPRRESILDYFDE